MLIITIRTDNPQAELGLFNNDKKIDSERWLAHRDLSVTIHQKIETLLKNHQKDWHDIDGIVCFKGPGSFTGLRIGFSVVNALGYGLKIPAVGTKGDGWEDLGIKKLLSGKNDELAMPEYGQEPHITKQKK